MNRANLKSIAKEILARPFAEMNDDERREYLREYDKSRWNPGQGRTPPRKRRKKRR